MNTPITDLCKNMLYGTVPADISRRLETDRAALMEIVSSYVESGHSRGLAARATEVLAAALANFPTP